MKKDKPIEVPDNLEEILTGIARSQPPTTDIDAGEFGETPAELECHETSEDPRSIKPVTQGKWVQQWAVRSSSGHGDYIVSKDTNGDYACACRGWTGHTPRTDCKHIREVKAGGGKTIAQATIDRMAGR